MELRALAVSAPDWISGAKDGRAINSRDPASLFNACRRAGAAAEAGTGAWGASNWAGSRRDRRERLLLMYSLDDMPAFEALLARELPNLLLIGAMSLCLPGAVACALAARRILGSGVLVVLGGRHPSETVYLDRRAARGPSGVRHHPGSPLALMAAGRIPRVFDAVVSGDGEELVAALGEATAASRPGDRAGDVLARISPAIPGDWILGWLDGDAARALVSAGRPLDYASMPSPVRVFGISGGFDVFGGRPTAHAFSDTGRGCVYDCGFCSERSSVTGGVRDAGGASARLARQLRDAAAVVAQDHPGRGASAFVEDSVLLAGSPRLIDRFVDDLARDPVDVRFGAQLTVDQILSRRSQLEGLASVGLSYAFIGVETLDPGEIGGMSKDLGARRAPWLARLAAALETLRELEIACGCAVLFGLGEAHASRLALVEQLSILRGSLGAPDPVSVNWAVQHPLCGQDGGAGYEYVEWGTPQGPFLDLFHRFGEASVRYPLPQVGPPRLAEVAEVCAALDGMAAPAAAPSERAVA